MNKLMSKLLILNVQSSILYYLQCTTIGPPLAGFAAQDFFTNARTGKVYSGIPWSGHSV